MPSDLLLAAQAQNHVTPNEALRNLDTIVNLSVTRRNLPEPPAAWQYRGELERNPT
jgi:hypothetical protein